MRLYSTNGNSPEVNFETALLHGLAPDKGLYMPCELPHFSADEINSMKELSYAGIAFRVASKFLGDEVDFDSLKAITQDAYDFDVPIEKVSDIDYIMRLDRGPTASFKDFAARMMARLMQYFMKKHVQEILILTATSGDTGSAVAQAFHGLKHIRVVVLFPKDEVTDRQRKQMTTLGNNISAIAVDGKFDDCQTMVKQAFSDPELKNLNLSSANSINFGRLLPQAVYYFYAYSRVNNPIFCVPCGNFGNLMGGLLAMKMGLPIDKFIVAVNENDEFPSFMSTRVYNKVVPSKNSLSNAMNVGHPSNLARLITLYGGHMDETGRIHKMPNIHDIEKDIWTLSVTDSQTKQAIIETYRNHKIIIEPHGAVGWYGLQRYRESTKDKRLAVSLETADPAKFPDEIIRLIGVQPDAPASLKLDDKTEKMEHIDSDYGDLKNFLTTTFKT